MLLKVRSDIYLSASKAAKFLALFFTRKSCKHIVCTSYTTQALAIFSSSGNFFDLLCQTHGRK